MDNKILLDIHDLHASIDGKEILKGINLTVREGEVHAIMGPNGSGKSTLSMVLAGAPGYSATEGTVDFHGKELLELSATKDSSCRSNTRWRFRECRWSTSCVRQ